MTDLIDLNYGQTDSCKTDSQEADSDAFFQNSAKIYCIQQIMSRFINKMQKIDIKTFQTYLFEVDPGRILLQNNFYYHPVKIVALISLGGGIFSMRTQFYDQKGTKLTAKSTYHRTVISNFLFQINCQLENFKLEFNPVSGEFSFLFDLKAQLMDRVLLTELIQFALDCYIQECQAHFYVLHLIQHVHHHKNHYLKNIEEDFTFLKRWILQRKRQNASLIHKFSFYQKIQRLQNDFLQNLHHYPPQKNYNPHIKIIKKYLYPEPQPHQHLQQVSALRTRQFYKWFKRYYRQDQITRNYMTNKTKYQNLLKIKPKQTKSFEQFLKGKSIFREKEKNDPVKNSNSRLVFWSQSVPQNGINQHKNGSQMQEQTNSQRSSSEQNLRLWDSESGKNYNVKLMYLKSSAKKEIFIVQKLCKLQSFCFINQYIELENYVNLQNDYAVVNLHPRRLVLEEFLRKNNKILSLSSRLKIGINLVEILYTLQLKSKIQNYLPVVSVRNLQISRNLSLNFMMLSHFSIFPLLQLINAISMIMFETPLHQFKSQNVHNFYLIKGDEIQNKNWGVSFFVYCLKFYITEIYDQFLRTVRVEEMKSMKKLSQVQSVEVDNYKKERLTRTCQQLLVILKHCQSVTSRGLDQKYSFQDESDSED